MSNNYRSVLASGGGVQPTGDAVAADVLTGKTFSNANAVGVNGTMPNNGAVSGTAAPGQPYTIPAGYHNGSGVVTASGGSWKEKALTLTNLTVGKCYVLFLAAYTTANLTITGGTVLVQQVEGNGYGLALVKATATTITVTSGAAASPMKVEFTLD